MPASTLAVGVLLTVVFVRRQRRLSRPLLDVSLFTRPAFTVAIAVLTLGSLVLAGVGFLSAQYLQLVLGLTPLVAGLWTLPPLAAGIVAVVATQALGERLTVARSTAGGLVIAAAGLLILTQVDTSGVATIVVGLALIFAGLMPVLARGVDTVTGSVAPDRAGAASARPRQPKNWAVPSALLSSEALPQPYTAPNLFPHSTACPQPRPPVPATPSPVPSASARPSRPASSPPQPTLSPTASNSQPPSLRPSYLSPRASRPPYCTPGNADTTATCRRS